jgi:Tol biopolymer transport system component
MTRDVFISHAGDDAGVAVEVCALLEKRGLKCWMAPRDVAAGSVWDEAILDAIETSRVFLLILSKSANQSQFVKNEVNRAFSQGKPIVTFRLEDVPPGRSLELYLARHHWTDAFPPPMGARIETLATSITALLDMPAPVAAAPAALPPRPTLGARLLSSLLALTKDVRAIGGLGLIVSVITLLLGAAIAGLFIWNLRPAPAGTPPVRFVISLPGKLAGLGATTSGTTAPVAVSSDGQKVAFVALAASNQYVLWVRSLDSLTAQPLAGTEGASSPFWSPDSRYLGFFADGKLKKVEVAGGEPITLCDAPDNRGGTWSTDGTIIFNPSNRIALQKVNASGGQASAATTLGQGEQGHMRPVFLPDGQHFLYRATNGSIGGPVYLATLGSSERKMLLNADSQNVLYTQGHLLFLRGTTLMAQAFDLRSLAVTGDVFPLAEQIQTTGANPPYGVFSGSGNGVIAYQSGKAATSSQLIWLDRAGNQAGFLGDPAAYTTLSISPDGKRVAVSILDGAKEDLWIYDVARALRTRFTFDSARTYSPIWSPDGTHIAFGSIRKGPGDLYQKASNGNGEEQVLVQDTLTKSPTSWSPDGKLILYNSFGGPTGDDLFLLPLTGDRKPYPFLQTAFNEEDGHFSPDGRWVVYNSNESGRYEIYVVPFPGAGGKWQISASGGRNPRWRRDGSEIIFLGRDNRLMAAAVNGKGTSIEVGAVKPLFETRTTGNSNGLDFDMFDLSPDGQRILIPASPGQTESASITVVLNWTSGLKK